MGRTAAAALQRQGAYESENGIFHGRSPQAFKRYFPVSAHPRPWTSSVLRAVWDARNDKKWCRPALAATTQWLKGKRFFLAMMVGIHAPWDRLMSRSLLPVRGLPKITRAPPASAARGMSPETGCLDALGGWTGNSP